MGYPTPIEWTDATLNLVGGCSIHSPGCAECYAMELAGSPRLRDHPLYAGVTSLVKGKHVFNGALTILPPEHPAWRWPVGWRGAKEPKLGAGKPSLIFVADMADLFHKDRPRADIDRVFASLIYSRHVAQLLTKRPDVMADYVLQLRGDPRWLQFVHPALGQPNFDPMVADFEPLVRNRFWFGFSAERQKEFDERWPHMKRIAALGFTIFLSYEPALGPLVLPDDFLALGDRAQVIAGGESGANARPPSPWWFIAIRNQCIRADVAFFFKQWGAYEPCVKGYPGSVRVGEFSMIRGRARKAPNRVLSTETWNQFPRVAA